MFDIGFTELVLLAGLGLIVLGPQRLPKVAAQLGRWVGQARRMSRTLMYQLRQEVDLDDPRPFSTRRQADAGAKAKASPKKKAGEEKKKAGEKSGGDKEEKGRDKQETQAETAQRSGKGEAERSGE